MNPSLSLLHPYPFERLRTLLGGARAPAHLSHISMSIGEPRHAPPAFVLQAVTDNLPGVARYPATQGLPQLREAIAGWLTRRFDLPAGSIDPGTMVLPVNGTREALFAFVQCAIDAASRPCVVMPNPFYQIYEGAALLAGAQPYFMPDRSLAGESYVAGSAAGTGGDDLTGTSGDRFLPDLDAVPPEVWQRCQILFLCSPGNPTGAVASLSYLRRALELAERYDFIVASDECYSEIYFDEDQPPAGLLQAAVSAGHSKYERCLVFHSLSKRSSVPGLRSGFVAGDASLVRPFLLYRTYHGSAMPLPTQLASIAAWSDEAHVVENRRLYREKFAQVLPILRSVMAVEAPQASFYLWPRVHASSGAAGGAAGGATSDAGERFTRELFERQHVTVLPGSYIARETRHGNPGRERVRISLVAALPECVEAAERIRAYVADR